MTARVLQLLLSPAIGGAETLAFGLEAGLSEHGFEVQTGFLDPAGSSASPLARIARIRALVRAVQPDIVLAHSALPNLYARLVAGRRLPVVVVLHSASRDFDNPMLRLAERALRRRTALVVAVARPQATEYRSAFGSSVQLELIPNGVSVSLGAKPCRASAEGQVRVVTLARINQQKDPATWRGAALLAVATRPDLAFAWSGPRAAEVDQQALVAATGHPSVTWAGPTSEPGAVLAAADIYFHPARAEAHPLAPLEAAAVGLPVVCSDAVASSLPAGMPAATFATGDAAAAAAAVLAVADDLPAAMRHAAAWRPRVLTEYGMERVLADYARVLNRVVL
jgi:L-malate glycosyltransferase